MKATTTGIIALIGVVAFVIFFFLVPIISYNCQAPALAFSASGIVSLSCEVFGFGEIYQKVSTVSYNVSGSAWTSDCDIPNNSVVHCTSRIGAIDLNIRIHLNST